MLAQHGWRSNKLWSKGTNGELNSPPQEDWRITSVKHRLIHVMIKSEEKDHDRVGNELQAGQVM